MKAIQCHQYGPPESLTIEEVTLPVPKENELLVKVKACTVNRTDCAILTGKPFIMRLLFGLLKPKTPFLGTDFAGEVVAVGPAIENYKVGDRIFGFNDNGLASQAEYLTISPGKPIALMPESMDFSEAVACLEGAHYAYNFINKIELQVGHQVLVNGASGAIGSAAVQIAKHFGAEITAVCNTKNIELVKSLGANRVIDYLKEDFTRTQGSYDFIFDAVGKSSFFQCKPLLKSKGIYISSELGWMSQNLWLALVSPLLPGKKVAFPIPLNIDKSIELVKSLIDQGEFQAVIDRKYALEESAKAYTYVISGQKTGNVLLSFPD